MAGRVFLDVGAHQGETLEEVVKPRWRFDRIWCFEPATVCLQAIGRFVDERVEVVNAGLGARDETALLHDPGTIGASVHAAKALTEEAEEVRIVDASAWLSEHVGADDVVWMKVNCEGSECDLLDHLVATGAISKVDHLLVHFDVEKIPGMGHRATETRRRLEDAGVAWIEASLILFGRSHALKTANWLAWTEAARSARLCYRHMERWKYRTRQLLYPLKQQVRQRRQVLSDTLP